ncbi:MAG: protein TolR [Alphaproteobacteria bacterium]|nr:protein TolR [Alphaproteobacteria bacterium]
MNAGGGRGRGRRAARSVSDINVTPLVDVMLVLLIVFMITAPMMTTAVPIDLPRTQGRTVNQDKEPLVVSVSAEGRVYVQSKAVRFDEMIPKLKAITGANPDARIFVRGDKALEYGKIMEVMGAISAAGFSKVALVAELPNGKR